MENTPNQSNWYDKTWVLVLLFMFVLTIPVGIYGMWKNLQINRGWKIFNTIVFGLFFLIVIFTPKDTPSSTSDNQSMNVLGDSLRTQDVIKKGPSYWGLVNEVDDFGDLTGRTHMTTHSRGTFSNSFGTGVSFVTVYFGKTEMGIMYKTHNNRDNNQYSLHQHCDIIMRNTSGKELRVSSIYPWRDRYGMRVDDKYKKDFSRVVEFIKESQGEIRVLFGESEKVRFSIMSDGFTDLYDNL